MGESIAGKLICADQIPFVRPQDCVLKEEDLKTFFSQFGEVDKVIVRKSKANSTIKMFGISFVGRQTATEQAELLFGNFKVLKFTKKSLLLFQLFKLIPWHSIFMNLYLFYAVVC